MKSLGIYEGDITEKFIRGSGPGGQKINKTASCVYLQHRPSGIEIKCQASRSQALNRFIARKELCTKIEERILGRESQKQRDIHKKRKQKARRSRRTKEKILGDKRARSDVKSKRSKVSQD